MLHFVFVESSAEVCHSFHPELHTTELYTFPHCITNLAGIQHPLGVFPVHSDSSLVIFTSTFTDVIVNCV